ncbi:putative ammonium transporter 3 [Limulus polyphemus]|uniref:Ammonium transporter 3 n=1 Tax=Limulus polyphemus TaxID=6850 RepID=A0ABM1C0C1_LIMPO|nr:putative ammonium transporter 3 [Limulus polyphemus]
MDSVMGSLVAISGGCAILRPWEALVIGGLGALFVLLAIPIIDWLHIDDPVNTFAVHGVGGLWGMLAIGLLSERDFLRNYTRGLSGLLFGGGWQLLGVQALSAGVLICWSVVTSVILLNLVKITLGLRMTVDEEIMGPDFVDHCIQHDGNRSILNALRQRMDDLCRTEVATPDKSHVERKTPMQRCGRSLKSH